MNQDRACQFDRILLMGNWCVVFFIHRLCWEKKIDPKVESNACLLQLYDEIRDSCLVKVLVLKCKVLFAKLTYYFIYYGVFKF